MFVPFGLFAANVPQLAARSYVDGMYRVVDAAKVDVDQGIANKDKVVVTNDSGQITTSNTLDLTKISVPPACIREDAMCVLAFKNGQWVIVDVTPDPEDE